MEQNYTLVTDKYVALIEKGNQLNRTAFENLIKELEGVKESQYLSKLASTAHPQINNEGIMQFIEKLYQN